MAYKQKSECWSINIMENILGSLRITILIEEENVKNWRDHVSHNFFDNDQISNKQLQINLPRTHVTLLHF